MIIFNKVLTNIKKHLKKMLPLSWNYRKLIQLILLLFKQYLIYYQIKKLVNLAWKKQVNRQFSLLVQKNPQFVKTHIIFQNGYQYDLSNPHLSYFITNAKMRNSTDIQTIFTFLIDLKYNTKYADIKSERYKIITQTLTPQLNSSVLFLPSDPNELVEKLKLFYFEILGGKSNLNEESTAITDTLLNYEIINTSQHYSILENFNFL